MGIHAYVADGGFGGLQVIDTSDPFSPRLIGSVDTPGWAWGVAVDGTHIYMADREGGFHILPTQCLAADAGVDGPISAPAILRVFPNPSAGDVFLRLRALTEGPLRARVFDSTGRLVRALFDGNLSAGVHELTWDGRDDKGRSVPAGIYLVRAAMAEGTETGRLVVLD